jgi:hypothetical protein
MTTATDPTTLDAADDPGAAGRTTSDRRRRPGLGRTAHGVCIRPLAMRRIDTTTGRIDVVPVHADPPEKTNADPARTRPAGCGWSNAARAGTSKPSRSPTGPCPARTGADGHPGRSPGRLHRMQNSRRRDHCEQSPRRSPNLIPNSAPPACADGSPLSIQHPNRSSAPPGAVKMPRMCLAERSIKER